jgi:hypothetical protein
MANGRKSHFRTTITNVKNKLKTTTRLRFFNLTLRKHYKNKGIKMNIIIKVAGIASVLFLSACAPADREDINSTELTNEHYDNQERQQQNCMLTGEIGCAN